MKKLFTIMLSCVCLLGSAIGFTACGGEKNITVITRDGTSGTREAFETKVTDGNGNYLEMKPNGQKVSYTTEKAINASSTGTVLTKVASDKNAIGYVSLGSVNNSVKVVSVNGVAPSSETVLDGSYQIQRPFVVMTNANVELTDLAADFLLYLKSGAVEAHAEKTGCIFLADPAQRANEGEEAIPVGTYQVKSSLPAGGKLVVTGSTSMQIFMEQAMLGYANLYGREVSDIFDAMRLNGSSAGRKDVNADQQGNVIGMSSASVHEEGINSFNICLDAVAVIVNVANESVNDLTLAQLYDIYTGKVTKFSELNN